MSTHPQHGTRPLAKKLALKAAMVVRADAPQFFKIRYREPGEKAWTKQIVLGEAKAHDAAEFLRDLGTEVEMSRL